MSTHFKPTFATHPEVELHNLAVWTRNMTVQFRRGKGSSAGSGRIEDRSAGKRAGWAVQATSSDSQTINLAEFLRNHVSEEDFLLLQMDVEGGEYTLLPHLISANVTHLIDKMFVELHAEKNTCCSPPTTPAETLRTPWLFCSRYAELVCMRARGASTAALAWQWQAVSISSILSPELSFLHFHPKQHHGVGMIGIGGGREHRNNARFSSFIAELQTLQPRRFFDCSVLFS